MARCFHGGGDFFRHEANDYLHVAGVEANDPAGAEAASQRFIDQRCILNAKAQAGDAGVDIGEIIGTADGGNVLARQRADILLFCGAQVYIFAVGGAAGNGQLAARRQQVEAGDGEAENQIINREVH